MAKIPLQSLVILFSGSVSKFDEEAMHSFFVNRHFFYLSNISQANSWLVLWKDKNKNDEYLFINKNDQNKEKWFGRQLSKIDACKLSSIDKNKIFWIESLECNLNLFLKEKKIKNIFFDFSVNEKDVIDLKMRFEKKKINIFDIYSLICQLRMQKDQLEIGNIKQAIEITKLGIYKIIKEMSHFKKEFEIYNAFNEEVLNHGTHELAFPSIIAAGVNACYLHYPTPYADIMQNQLILCDVGAAYHHYASDITRTLPVNGCFSIYQKKIYEIVLNCNKKIINSIRPNITLEELQEMAKNYLAEQCLLQKIIQNKTDIINYYYHNISHHLGLNVHDVYLQNTKLVPGMVITVEPGLYIQKKKIGIRIEDVVLVTKKGFVCLSSSIPKEIKDIEAIFKNKVF